MTAAIHAYADATGLPRDTPGRRVRADGLVPGDLILDPSAVGFVPRYVRISAAYPRFPGEQGLLVRPVTDAGRLGDVLLRTLPVDTVVTAWSTV